jgi:hypothetical protein
MFATTANAQIMYNKVKPVSLESQTFKQIQDLPIIDFPVEDNGSMMQSNLNLIVKNKAIFESANDKNIARMMIKVNAQSLGNITVSFKDVLLDNNSYCLVYTQDHQIVAGPIYQKSINNNKFTIMNIPASELILEVIYNSKNDFTMKLDEVSFTSLVNLKEVKKNKQEQLLSGSCDDFGVVSYVNNVLATKKFEYDVDYENGKFPCDSNNSTNRYTDITGCDWLINYLNDSENDDIWFYDKYYQANDSIFVDFKSNRSACILMLPINTYCFLDSLPDSLKFRSVNATLINIPTENCNNSFIVASAHELGAIGLDSLFNSEYSREYSIVRFNWHYKYGTPEHLKHINCNASTSNFDLWRSTIDFSEVIDYQGVDVFAKDKTFLDFIILKLRCKTFFKEYHLGWTTQKYYDFYKYLDVGEYYDWTMPNVSNEMFTIGSRTGRFPKGYFSNYFVLGQTASNFMCVPLSKYRFLGGWSGSNLIYNNYENSTHQISLGITQAPYSNFGYHGIQTIFNRYSTMFNYSLEYFPNSSDKKIWTYFQDSNFVSLFNLINKKTYTYDVDKITKIDSITEQFYWYPSMNNKEKCPSPVEPEDPCDFDINDYITYSNNGDEICVTISEIPDSKFPDPLHIPRGFRAYHNFGEQKTIHWDSFQDGQDISFPIVFCIDKCRLAYLASLGKNKAKIAIDFYDVNGRVYNNPGCDSVEFEFDINLCEFIDYSIEPIFKNDSCCTYEVTLDFNSFDDCESFNPGMNTIDSIYNSVFSLSDGSNSILLSTLDGFTKTGNQIKFEISKCEVSENDSTLYISSDNFECEIAIDLTECSKCACPEDHNDWLTFEIAEGDCDGGGCLVDLKLDIPQLYSCYTHYSISSNGQQSIPAIIPPNGELQFPQGNCISKGDYKTFRVYLRKSGSWLPDSSCYIDKSVYCPINSSVESCVPDCDSVGFTERELDFDLIGCPNCKIKVKYSYRTNTCYVTPTQDIQILSMEEVSDPSYPTACGNCSAPTSEIYRQSVLAVIHRNEMGFDPNENDESCDTTWRLVQSSCWAEFSNPLAETGGKIYIPCDSVECCYSGMRVCRMTDGSVVVTPLSFSVTADTCTIESMSYTTFVSPSEPDTAWADCEFTCDWMFGIAGTYNAKPIFSSDDKELYTNNPNFEIEMFNYGDLLNLKVNSKIESNHFKLQLQSIEGRIIEERINNLTIGVNEFPVRLSNLNSGVYMLNVFESGKHIITRKIIITR